MYTYKKRKQRVILGYRGYSVDDPVNFKTEHVLLFDTFLKSVDILDGNRFERIYDEHMDVIPKEKARYLSDIDVDEVHAVFTSLLCPNDEELSDTPELLDDRERPAAMENADSDLLDIGAVEPNGPFKQCPAVRTRQDVMSTYEYLDTMHMRNEEQHEIVREVVHRLTTPDSPPLQIFFTGVAGCGKTLALRS